LTGLERDLEHILAQTADIWEEFRESTVFFTGGTGFFGRWLLASFAAANDRFRLNAKAVVLTRDAAGFAHRSPELTSHPAITIHPGDVRGFDFPKGRFSHIVHAATPASAALNSERPLEMQDIIVEGTRRVLEFARGSGARKLLLCSSGAVYGRQPPELEHVPEEYSGGPDILHPGSAYGKGKRIAELMCVIYAREYGLEPKIARGFAFLGPYLPLDAHFAVGNFLRDALEGKNIRVEGDGTPYRSYLYAADLAIWLWTILTRGQTARAYNVGAEAAISVADLARLVAATVAPGTSVEIRRPAVAGKAAERYVPSTARARAELGLREHTDLPAAIRLTADWHRLRLAS